MDAHASTTHRSGGLLVAGTASGVGKTTLVAGLCRWLAQSGVRVAPFKASTIALESVATQDGCEIARAQALQAAAAGLEPTAAMNPLLLKPGADGRLHALVRGQVADPPTVALLRDEPDARRALAIEALDELRSSVDIVICEGSGAAGEVGVADTANTALAVAAGMPVLLVASVELGGASGSILGTLELLPAAEARQVAGYVLTRHRGVAADLAAVVDDLLARTGRRTLGVVPWTEDLGWEPEDATSLDHLDGRGLGEEELQVVVVGLPHASNLADLDPLVAEPAVNVRSSARPGDLLGAHLVIVPGTRAVLHDLAWLRGRGLDRALAARVAAGRPVLGLCGGYQLLGEQISDPHGVEAPAGATAEGLGLLPIATTFRPTKMVARRRGTAVAFSEEGGLASEVVTGFELRHGHVESRGEPLLRTEDDRGEGCVHGVVWGTSWHGLLDNDGLREHLLSRVARGEGLASPASGLRYAVLREERLDRLAALVTEHLDTHAISELLPGAAASTSASR